MDRDIRLEWHGVVWAISARVTRNADGLELHTYKILEARWSDRSLLTRPENACAECGKSDIATILRFGGEATLRRRVLLAIQREMERA